MLHVNLVSERRKRRAHQRQALLFAAALVGLVTLVMIVMILAIEGRIIGLRGATADLEKESRNLRTAADEVEQDKAVIAQLEPVDSVVKECHASVSTSLALLGDLARYTPTTAWVDNAKTNFDSKKLFMDVRLEGKAVTHEEVGELWEDLGTAQSFDAGHITLERTQKVDEEADVMRYELVIRLKQVLGENFQ